MNKTKDDEVLERLEHLVKIGFPFCDSALAIIKSQKAEIKRLKEEIHKGHIAFQKRGDFYRKEIKSAKSEAIKEFAERLKEKAEYFSDLPFKTVDVEHIDNLVKEMVGDTK